MASPSPSQAAARNTQLSSRLTIQWRRSWMDPWTWDLGTVAIGPFSIGGGNTIGACTLISLDTAAGNREAGAMKCPLQQGYFVRVVSKDRLISDSATLGRKRGDPVQVFASYWLAESSIEALGGQASNNATAGQRLAESRVEQVTWSGIGLLGLLGQIDLHRFWAGCGSDYFTAVLGTPAWSLNRRNDRSARPPGLNCLYGKVGAGAWTADVMLAEALRWHLYDVDQGGNLKKRFPHWPDFVLSNCTQALSFPVEDVHASGTLLDLVLGLIHPRRGTICTADIPQDPNAAVNLRIDSLLRNPITVPLPDSTTMTLPASNYGYAVLKATDPHTSLNWGPQPPPRRLTLLGRRSVAIVSLRWSLDSLSNENGALTRGWLAADDSHAGSIDVQYDHVFRRFRLRPGWTGDATGTTQISLTGMHARSGSNDPIHGEQGMTGQILGGSTSTFPELSLEFIDQIPCPALAIATGTSVQHPLKDWLSATTGIILDKTAEMMRPMAFIHHRGANAWERVDTQISFPDPRTVVLGSGPSDARALKSRMSRDSDDLVITCAVALPYPLAVSYEPKINPSKQLLSADRVRRIDWAERIVVRQGTVMGLDLDQKPVASTVDRTVRDDVGTLRAMLALMRPAGERAASAVFTDRLNLRADLNPGQLIQQVELPRMDNYDVDINYVITEVQYDPSLENYGTQVTIELPAVDLEAML